MKQKNEKAVFRLLQKKTTTNWLILGNLLVYLGIILVSSSFTACEKNPNDPKPVNVFPVYSNKVILDWNSTALNAMEAPNYQHVLVASRLYTMVHIAQYDALNSIKPVYKRYCNTTTDVAAHPVAAAAVAAYTVLLNQLPAKKAILDSQLAKSIDTISNLTAKQKGITLGTQCGNAILNLRKDDGAFQDPIGVIAPSTVPGVYQAVPPFDFVFAPFWTKMKPFGIVKPEQFRSVPPPALNSAIYTTDFNEVKNYGAKNSTVRTTDQTFYAKFWYEFSEIGWNRIGRVAATDHKLDLLATARLFALLDIVLADSYIAGWDSKFHYNLWRPYTAIRAAATDGNDKTEADTQWETLMPTPPVQDYPSTHSVLGNAGASVLTAFFGNSDFTFTTTSAEPVNASRSFKSFFKAADENADSRVRAGIHFRFATVAGQKMGNQIGDWVLKNLLKQKN